MDPATVTLLLLKLALNVYDESQAVPDYVFFEEGTRITITGYFEGLQEMIICDDEFYYNCSRINKQHILLKGESQVLIQLSIYPWYYGDRIYFHPLGRDGPLFGKGYQFIIGQIYEKSIPIDRGMD